MKSTKKETKSSGEFPKEFDALRNSALFNIANRGITPLQPLNNGSHQFNPFFPTYQQPVSPWAFNPSQPTPSPVFGVQPTSPYFSPFQPGFQQPSQFFGPFSPSQQNSNPAFFGAQEVTSSVNISEEEDSYIIELTVPGYKNEDCKVKVKERVLFVYGRRELEKETGFYSLKEYRNTFFERSFLLSDEVDTEDIEASCVDGILTLRLPKKSKDALQEKEIEITEEQFA
jgi:HSP20 family protein